MRPLRLRDIFVGVSLGFVALLVAQGSLVGFFCVLVSVLSTVARAVLSSLAFVAVLGALSPYFRSCLSVLGSNFRMSLAEPDGRKPKSASSAAAGNSPAASPAAPSTSSTVTDKDYETGTNTLTSPSTPTAPAPSVYGFIMSLLSAALTLFPRAPTPILPPGTPDTTLTPTTTPLAPPPPRRLPASPRAMPTRNSTGIASGTWTPTSSTDTLGQSRQPSADRTTTIAPGSIKSDADNEISTGTRLYASAPTPPTPQATTSTEMSPPTFAPTSSDNTTTTDTSDAGFEGYKGTTSNLTPRPLQTIFSSDTSPPTSAPTSTHTTATAMKSDASTGNSTTPTPPPLPTTNTFPGTSTPTSAATTNDNGILGPTPSLKNVNRGIVAKAAQIDTLNSNFVNDSFNETAYYDGADRAARAFSGVFYVYIHDVAEDMHSRMVIIFASCTVADEWWHAVSTSYISILKGNINRITPQFYTHDTRQWNVYNFFTEPRIREIAERFRGRMFLDLENDRSGRGITIIPTQSTVDHASGDWFSIRSKANADHYWYYDEALGCITVSDTQRTSFKISATNMHDGAIMISVDAVTLTVQHHGFVVPQCPNGPSGVRVLGVTALQSEAFEFKFGDLDKGHFVPGKDKPASPLCYVPQGIAGAGWELVL